MEIHGNPWKSMEIHGNPWKSMEIHENPWKSMEIVWSFPRFFGSHCHTFLWYFHSIFLILKRDFSTKKVWRHTFLGLVFSLFVWISTLFHGFPGIMGFQGNPWISMDFHGFPWIFMDFHGFSWIFMDFHGFPWISMDFHGFPWVSMDFHAFPWISMDFHEF